MAPMTDITLETLPHGRSNLRVAVTDRAGFGASRSWGFSLRGGGHAAGLGVHQGLAEDGRASAVQGWAHTQRAAAWRMGGHPPDGSMAGAHRTPSGDAGRGEAGANAVHLSWSRTQVGDGQEHGQGSGPEVRGRGHGAHCVLHSPQDSPRPSPRPSPRRDAPNCRTLATLAGRRKDVLTTNLTTTLTTNLTTIRRRSRRRGLRRSEEEQPHQRASCRACN